MVTRKLCTVRRQMVRQTDWPLFFRRTLRLWGSNIIYLLLLRVNLGWFIIVKKPSIYKGKKNYSRNSLTVPSLVPNMSPRYQSLSIISRNWSFNLMPEHSFAVSTPLLLPLLSNITRLATAITGQTLTNRVRVCVTYLKSCIL